MQFTQRRAFLQKVLSQISGKSKLAQAIRYATSRWTALTRYTHRWPPGDDQQRGRARDQSDSGGVRAAATYTIIESAKMTGLDPEAYLRDILARIADQPINRIHALLPWNWTPLA